MIPRPTPQQISALTVVAVVGLLCIPVGSADPFGGMASIRSVDALGNTQVEQKVTYIQAMDANGTLEYAIAAWSVVQQSNGDWVYHGMGSSADTVSEVFVVVAEEHHQDPGLNAPVVRVPCDVIVVDIGESPPISINPKNCSFIHLELSSAHVGPEESP